MGQGFVIVEKSYEYNDEVYYTTEDDAGSPVHVYTDRAKAENERIKLERKKFRGCEIRNYAYSITELSSLGDEGAIEEALSEIFNPDANASKKMAQYNKDYAAWEVKRSTRISELTNKLTGTLSGRALKTAISDTLEQEGLGVDSAPDEPDSPSIDLDDFEIPNNISDEQLDKVIKIFDNLSFYEIVTTGID